MAKDGNTRMSRRTMMSGGLAVAAGSAAMLVAAGRSDAAPSRTGPYTHAEARQDVEYLRRWYGIGTDLLGLRNDPESLKRGRSIYAKVFTPDSQIYLGPHPIPAGAPPTRVGPDAWADFVENVYKTVVSTQHLLGTQIAEIDEMPDGIPGKGRSKKGHGTCISYLHAWNISLVGGENKLTITISIYRDSAKVVPGVGWQIYHSNLTRVSGESRVVP